MPYVFCLFVIAGFNHTTYYPSSTFPQSSLCTANSSESEFTFFVMAIVSLIIPFVVAYISYTWRQIDKNKITKEEISASHHSY